MLMSRSRSRPDAEMYIGHSLELELQEGGSIGPHKFLM